MAESFRVSALLRESAWRRGRLLILCYHGVSLEDEHLWNSSLYMPAALFRQRLEMVRAFGAAVLPLEEAIPRMQDGTLPSRSVAITFDDGLYDFYRAAHPILREFGYPATVYFTTYYSDFPRPVFDVACSYLLWKASGRRLEWSGLPASPLVLDDPGRQSAVQAILSHARHNRFSAKQKDDLLAELAARLNLDYEDFRARRILQLMQPAEAAELARSGVDLQLHTHRHRLSMRREVFLREIDDNRQRVAALSGRPARHFCYPGGVHRAEFLGWLRERSILSATTCELGLASRAQDPLLLPRLVDTSGLTPHEFRSWLSGLAALLPHRASAEAGGQFFEEA